MMSKKNQVRLKWYEVRCNLSLNGLAERLLSSPYNDDTSSGFDIEILNSKSIQGFFIEKIAERVSAEDPFGNLIESEIVRFIRVQFKLIALKSGVYFCRLSNSPRSISTFFEVLKRISSNQIFYKQIKFDINRLCDEIVSSSLVDRYSIPFVAVSSVPLTLRSIANIEVMSQSNALQEVTSLYVSKEFKLKKLEVEARVKSADCFIELRDSCVVLASAHAVEFVDSIVMDMVIEHRY